MRALTRITSTWCDLGFERFIQYVADVSDDADLNTALALVETLLDHTEARTSSRESGVFPGTPYQAELPLKW